MNDALIQVKNLKKYFKTGRGFLHAVDDVSFSIEKGETIGVVGESGCGKSSLGRTVLRLNEPTGGEILYRGQNLVTMSSREMKKIRPKM
ncbi:MAG: ATP-binding cassette domain-containing protein, partial [Oscillospiraceae bacterium]|nr:ATP-binding cassette domain-containing protein [Oscillospiraceae bacterium]